MNSKKIAWLITIVLFFIPFFWLKPGQVDLGGDANRLYYYDPLHFLLNYSLPDLQPFGFGYFDPNHYMIPFLGVLIFLKEVISSTYIIVSIFSGLKLALSFASVYLIINELLFSETKTGKQKNLVEIAAIFSALFYVCSLGSPTFSLGNQWVHALTSHNQVFLNPLMFYLILRFLLTKKNLYLFIALAISFFFSSNFSVTSAPPFFTFYPLAILYLFFYVALIRKKKLPWKKIFFGFFLFLGLHAFHLNNLVVSVFEKGSYLNTRFFNKNSMMSEGLEYFSRIVGYGKVSAGFFFKPQISQITFLGIWQPIILLLGFIFSFKNKKSYLYTGIFFLAVLFLVTANIANIFTELYKLFFYLPGFSMFRNFSIQWSFIFLFFYTLLLGQSLFVILNFLTKRYKIALISLILFYSIVGYIPFFKGDVLNGIHVSSLDVNTVFYFDPQYKETLDFIRSLPGTEKVMTWPLNDYGYQLIADDKNGAYMGTSSIAFLAGKRDFAGFQVLFPFYEEVRRFSRNKDYDAFLQLMSLLSVRYIYYNDDPNILEKKFPLDPYTDSYTALPKTQEEYLSFISQFPVKEIYHKSHYYVYEMDKKYVRPEIYIPQTFYQEKLNLNQFGNYVNTSFFEKDKSFQSAIIDPNICQNQTFSSICSTTYTYQSTNLTVKRISPAKYKIYIGQIDPQKPFLLIYQNAFHNQWQLSIDSSPVNVSSHVQANGYANAWLIEPNKIKNNKNVKMTLEFGYQRYFWYGVYISSVFFVMLVLFLGVSLFKQWKSKN